MLKALIAFAGFDRPSTPTLPPKARRTLAPPPAVKTAAVSDKPPVVSDRRSFDARILGKPHTVGEALLCVDKVHGGSAAWRSYTVGNLETVDAKARAVLGDELHSYCRARLMTDSKLEVVPKTVEADPAFNARLQEILEGDAVSDIDTWEAAMDEMGKRQKAAARAGLPLPAGLTIPAPVLVAIAQRQAERAVRLNRATGGGRSGSKGVPPPTPVGGAAPAEEAEQGSGSLKGAGSKRRRRDDDESGGGFVPPAPSPPGPGR